MLSKIDGFVVRRRRPILLLTAAVVVASMLSLRLRGGERGATEYLVLGAFGLIGFVWVLAPLAHRRSRPAMLVVDERRSAFQAPIGAGDVYNAIGTAAFPILVASTFAAFSAGYGWSWELLPLCAWIVLAGARMTEAWKGHQLQLRPDGIGGRAAFGSLFVPWDALAAGQPQRPDIRVLLLKLFYAQPQLVQRRGFRFRDRLAIASIHPWFIADVIRHYVEHPEHRAAIGAQDEYQRLIWQLSGQPGGAADRDDNS